MKKILLLLISAASFSTIHAQVRFGLKAGMNLANITNSGGGTTRVGFNGGVQTNIPVTSQFSVQPEIMYSSQGAKGDNDAVAVLNYINIPILFQYNNHSGFFAHTGPQFGFLLNAKHKQGNVTTDLTDVFKSSDFSWAFGGGYLFSSRFGFNARYNLGFTKIVKDGSSSKNVVFQVGAFYNLR
jgi:hypothetical protein